MNRLETAEREKQKAAKAKRKQMRKQEAATHVAEQRSAEEVREPPSQELETTEWQDALAKDEPTLRLEVTDSVREDDAAC